MIQYGMIVAACVGFAQPNREITQRFIMAAHDEGFLTVAISRTDVALAVRNVLLTSHEGALEIAIVRSATDEESAYVAKYFVGRNAFDSNSLAQGAFRWAFKHSAALLQVVAAIDQPFTTVKSIVKDLGGAYAVIERMRLRLQDQERDAAVVEAARKALTAAPLR